MFNQFNFKELDFSQLCIYNLILKGTPFLNK